MKYMLLTYMDEKWWQALDEAEQRRQMEECAPHVEAMQKSGKVLAGAPLQGTASATTVRRRQGKRLVTDGPFAETREQLGGYTIIDATDLDDAIAIASGFLTNDAPVSIEVRPIVELTGKFEKLPAH